MKFSANISTMLREYNFLERFSQAQLLGFEAVEIQSPYDFSPEQLASAKKDVKVDLINIFTDDTIFGTASLPMKEQKFTEDLQMVIRYYDVLNFKKLHIMSGKRDENFSFEDQYNTLRANLQALVDSDFLENRNAIGLIEPICPEVCKNYFLNCFDAAVSLIDSIGSDQIKLQLDVYHLHKITGDVKKYLDQYYKYAGHIQVSQDPGRCEPFHPKGVIDYQFVFDYLRKKGHNDFIGLEYVPSGSTAKSVEWIKDYL